MSAGSWWFISYEYKSGNMKTKRRDRDKDRVAYLLSRCRTQFLLLDRLYFLPVCMLPTGV